ncbi:NTE family protein [Terribacillus aidingensis]|uniref:NTE family protein n=1 Tax=Terribacillus aidingensis TaxID=586416 RepID=A0A285NPB5_9BACI|nr:patatin-like phospholipase family protein [Terribacillus aidingensis]SNZ10763.1 NTE family protein [Terribacillus aidingensis]
MKIDGVFSGGGVKAFAFIGAVQAVEEENYVFENIAGTSAGAIVAGLLAAGYSGKEMEQLLQETDISKFTDPINLTKYVPFANWLTLYFKMGLYKGNALERWLYEALAKKQIYTFHDVKPRALKVIAADVTLGRLIVFPDDLAETYGIDGDSFPVARAIRMSAGIPYIFMPSKLLYKNKKRSLLLDGGLLSNFPLWTLEGEERMRRRPILGMKLSESVQKYPIQKVHQSLDLFYALFRTMKVAHDMRHINQNTAKDIIFIPVEGVGMADFAISSLEKQKLIAGGRQKAEQFLKRWP